MANGNSIVPAPPVISKLPWGLLDIHGLKNGGAYPRNVDGNVQVIWDELGLMVGNYHEYARTTTTTAAPGATTIAAIPQGEVWYVDVFSVLITTGVGEAWNGYLALQNPQATSAVALSSSASQGASLLQAYTCPTRGFWVGAQDVLTVVTLTNTGTIDLTGDLRFLRMRV
jgi:hypothetical protein